MKVVQINSTYDIGSTGKICSDISKCLVEKGIENYIFSVYGQNKFPNIKYTNDLYIKIQSVKSHVNGLYGFNSKLATKSLIKKLSLIEPDIVHLHNLHSHNCDIEMLLSYLSKRHIRVFWTFHDCWAFTAYCTHYTLSGCNKWKNGCANCPQYKKYSWFFDKSNLLYSKKKKLIRDLDLTIISPSTWLENEIRQSFFSNFEIKVINNGIDLSVFKPINSNFRKENNISEDKFVLLGVSSNWSEKKGLDIFCRLANELDNDKFKLILVGTDKYIEKKIPKNILSIKKVKNQSDLAEIYSAADLFVNPTREETLGLVNIEANACGTPVLTFKTGGSPECINNRTGMIVNVDDVEALLEKINFVYENNSFSSKDCVENAKNFSSTEKYNEYISLYLNKQRDT